MPSIQVILTAACSTEIHHELHRDAPKKVLNLAKKVALSNQSEAVKNNRTPEEHVNHT